MSKNAKYAGKLKGQIVSNNKIPLGAIFYAVSIPLCVFIIVADVVK
jgi:hypothetical protein